MLAIKGHSAITASARADSICKYLNACALAARAKDTFCLLRVSNAHTLVNTDQVVVVCLSSQQKSLAARVVVDFSVKHFYKIPRICQRVHLTLLI